MTSRVSHTTIDCHDAFALSSWWSPVLGYTDVPEEPNQPGDEECMILDPVSGHRLLFIETGDPKEHKNRVHLDLVPVDRNVTPRSNAFSGSGRRRWRIEGMLTAPAGWCWPIRKETSSAFSGVTRSELADAS